MNKLLILLLFSITITAQYQIKSPYLQNPDNIIGYVDSCAAFWLKAYDSVNGGFYTNISKTGTVLTSSGTQKNMQTQSRNAYGLIRAFMLTGDETYLEKAKQALTFMYNHAWDNTNGGWYWELDKYGNPTSANTNKDAFHQHYGLLGPVAYYEATSDTTDWNWIQKAYNNNETKMWDNSTQYFGYYDYCSANWSSKNDKSFNATVDAITTHLLYLYLITQDEQYLNKAYLIADNMQNHFVASMNTQAIGFAEEYNKYWAIDANETMTIMGHILKTAWCFARLYHFNPNVDYTSSAENLIENVLEKGYDTEFGGPYMDYNRITGAMLMWGNPDTAKAWWQMEQAITAGLQMYKVTQKDIYLKMADETLDFFMKYFVDHQYGEVYENRTRYGAQTWGENKGNPNKAGYHSIELGYYTYLYGKFFVTKEPITLYYKFQAGKDRNIYLNPVEMPLAEYKIKQIEYNNQPYTDFIADTKVIHLPNSFGGKFKVTFELKQTDIAENQKTTPINYELAQNYPNPFNPSTNIQFTIAESGNVNLTIYDMLGREIETLINGHIDAGNHSISFNAKNLSSGIYIYRLKTNNKVISKKMTLLK